MLDFKLTRASNDEVCKCVGETLESFLVAEMVANQHAQQFECLFWIHFKLLWLDLRNAIYKDAMTEKSRDAILDHDVQIA